MLKFFRIPFALSGDKAAVPDTVDAVTGSVSYPEGFGFNYQRDFATDPLALNIPRDQSNQIYFDITNALAELQAQGIPDFITSALNGGTAYSYAANAVVRYSGDLYLSLVGSNTALPSDATKWALLPVPARLQAAYNTQATAAGTVDALTATFTPAIAALPAAPGALSVMVRAGGANLTTTPTFKADGTAAKTIVKGANGALAVGDIAGAGHWLHLDYDATLDKWVLQNPATGFGGATVSASAPVGTARNAKMSVTTASVSGTFTADEVIVTQSLGGVSYRLASYSQAVNLSTTGAGGMDTGSAPTSGFVSLYAIAQADGTKNILACNTSTSSGSIYAGANMPSGYVASALVGIWPTNSSGQFVPGLIYGRNFWNDAGGVNVLNITSAPPTSYTSVSLSAAVPAAALGVVLAVGQPVGGNAQMSAEVASSSSGLASSIVNLYGNGYAVESFYSGVQVALPILTAQTIYYKVGTSTGGVRINVTGYNF